MAAAALLSRRGAPTRNILVVVGALLPDFCIFVFYIWAKFIAGLENSVIWGEAYWTEPWLTYGAISNSVPLALVLLAVGIFWKKTLLSVFALALLVHAGLDFPLHADDAHRHFWPLTDWRFISPVSYWDPDHHRTLGSVLEFSVLTASAIVLWRRFNARWVRAICALSVLGYVSVSAYLAYAVLQA